MAKMSVNRLFVDTNVLTRATITTAPLHEQASAMLADYYTDGVELWISQQIIREYVANATRPQIYSQPIEPRRVLEQVKRFREQFQIAQETIAVLDKLLSFVETIPMGGKQVHDANIVATMLTYGIETLLTHNISDFARFTHYINIVPLKDSNL